jgi:hypothetical protein
LDSIIIFDPAIISREDPAGTGAFLIKKTSSPDEVTKKTSTLALVPVLLEIKQLNNTNVAEPPAVTTLVPESPVPALLTEDFVSILKVFAILA